MIAVDIISLHFPSLSGHPSSSFLYQTLYVKCSICELLVLNPDLDPLVIDFEDIGDQNVNR